jgi:hypothetical protein
VPRKIAWTALADDTILRLRQAGATWDAIAASVGASRNSVMERGKHLLLGTAEPASADIAAPPASPATEPPRRFITDRAPLPPGHPLSWAVLTDGTSLAGTAYPYPVFA